MIQKNKRIITWLVLITVTAFGLMLGMLADTDGNGAPKAEERTALLSDSLSTVDIVTGADTQYALIYSPSNQLNSTLATKLAALCGRTGALLRATPDSMMGVDRYVPMIGEGGMYSVNPYAEPLVYPTEGEHPSYLVNDLNYDEILEMFDDPEYAPLFDTVKELAEEDFNYGVFTGSEYRYDKMILARIEARAFLYLFTGEERYALEATIGIKNAIRTLYYTSKLHIDPYHGPSHVMRVTAIVFD